MNNDIKEIMRLSFHDSFFIDKYNPQDNYQYLDALVDFVLSKEENDDYEYIASKMWELDCRIKNIFQFNLEIVSMCFDDLDIEEHYIEGLNKVPDVADIKRIARCSKDVATFLKRVNIALIFINWDNLALCQKEYYTNKVLNYINRTYGAKIERDTIYKVKKFSEDTRLNIAINEMVCWLANQFKFKFSHQTIVAIGMLEEFEKIEMYFDIGKDLIERKTLDARNGSLNKILRNIIKPFEVNYVDNGDDFLIEISENELELANGYMYIQDKFCQYVHDKIEEKLQLLAELKRYRDAIQKEQTQVEKLNKNIVLLQHQIDKICKQKDSDLYLLQSQTKRMQNELFSLREYVFDRENSNNVLETNLGFEYEGDYRDIVIIGGHIKWQKKVVEQLKGINVVSTDQKVVDWSFLSRIKVVVIVTNYISHSMYYQVIDKTTNQKIIYVNYKNINQLKMELNHLLQK